MKFILFIIVVTLLLSLAQPLLPRSWKVHGSEVRSERGDPGNDPEPASSQSDHQ